MFLMWFNFPLSSGRRRPALLMPRWVGLLQGQLMNSDWLSSQLHRIFILPFVSFKLWLNCVQEQFEWNGLEHMSLPSCYSCHRDTMQTAVIHLSRISSGGTWTIETGCQSMDKLRKWFRTISAESVCVQWCRNQQLFPHLQWPVFSLGRNNPGLVES